MTIRVRFHPFNADTGIDESTVLEEDIFIDDGLTWDREERGPYGAIGVAISQRTMELERVENGDESSLSVESRAIDPPIDFPEDIVGESISSGYWDLPPESECPRAIRVLTWQPLPQHPDRNPWVKHLPDGSIDEYDIDNSFDCMLHEVEGELFNNGDWFKYDDGGTLRGVAVNVTLKTHPTSGKVRALVGRSQTTPSGTYCEILEVAANLSEPVFITHDSMDQSILYTVSDGSEVRWHRQRDEDGHLTILWIGLHLRHDIVVSGTGPVLQSEIQTQTEMLVRRK